VRALQSTILDSRLRPRFRRGLLALTACLAQIAYTLFGENEVGATVLFCDYFSCTNGCFGILEGKRKGSLYGATEQSRCVQTGDTSLWSKPLWH